MSTNPRGEISDENKRKLDTIYVAQIVHSERLAMAHLSLTRPEVTWGDLPRDEQASAVLAAHPWFLAARAMWFGGCPRCGCAPDTVRDLGGDRRECPDCGHRFEFREDD